MDFDIVMAIDSNNGFGNSESANGIPWNITDDMKRFKLISLQSNDDTKINAIIMGRITADTFKNPLINRLNVVITSHNDYRVKEGFVSYRTLNDALKNLKSKESINRVFVIGGKKIIKCAINSKYFRGIYMTVIHDNYKCDVKIDDNILDKIRSHMSILTCDTVKSFCKTKNNDVYLDYIEGRYQNREELAYLDLLEKILNYGDIRQTRNAKTFSLFGEKLEFDMDKGFPLLTTKKMFTRGILEELLFFMRGQTNTKILEDKKVMIWHENTTEDFIKTYQKNLEQYDMGPMYGYQWRYFNAPYKGCHESYHGSGFDQLKDVIAKLVTDPYSRRILMTAYNPVQCEEGVLYPCHGISIQFYVENDSRISLQMYQRSVDVFLGLPFNIASYAAMLHIIVNLVNNDKCRRHIKDYTPGRLIMIFGDAHIYSDDEKGDHIDKVKEQLRRRDKTYPFPRFELKKQLKSLDDINSMEVSDMIITDYICNSSISAKMVA